jgi:hypothetical protein
VALPDPKLDLAVNAMATAGARFVVVGGFAVIANRFVRATEDIEFLAPDDDDNDKRILQALRELGALRERDKVPLRDEHLLGQTHLRVRTDAIEADYGGVKFRVAGLRSIVGFKRLADRARDRNDLIGLEEVHGPLPIDPIPGLDQIPPDR